MTNEYEGRPQIIMFHLFIPGLNDVCLPVIHTSIEMDSFQLWKTATCLHHASGDTVDILH